MAAYFLLTSRAHFSLSQQSLFLFTLWSQFSSYFEGWTPKKARQRQSPKRRFFLVSGKLWRCLLYHCGGRGLKLAGRKET
jgi:hypothetical protein